MSTKSQQFSNNYSDTMNSSAMQLIGLRHRTFYILILCGTSVVACFLWLGRLPIDVSQGGQPRITTTDTVNYNYKSSMDTRNEVDKKNQYMDDDDDDETSVTRDDDFLQGERLRASALKKKQGGPPKDSKTGTTPTAALDVSYIRQKSTSDNDGKTGNSSPLMSDSDAKTSTSSKITVFEAPPSNSMTERIHASANKPKMVWLMSYPNSGTSYTMTMVARASEKATATNYGREVTEPNEVTTPLFDDQPWGGPFWRAQGGRPLPKDYILTKTHCGGRCVPCGPDEYVLNETEFLTECTRGAGLASLEDAEPGNRDDDPNFMDDGFQWVHYDPSIVKKAIHLIRSPFGESLPCLHAICFVNRNY
jgi:hypothetical protein